MGPRAQWVERVLWPRALLERVGVGRAPLVSQAGLCGHTVPQWFNSAFLYNGAVRKQD